MAKLTVNQEALRRLMDGSVPGSPGAVIRQEVEKVAEAARQEAPKDSGELAASIRVNRNLRGPTSISFDIVADAPYSKAVHEGTGPAVGHASYLPPFGTGSRLHRWAGKRGLRSGAVAHVIQSRGTEPNPFLKRAFERVWHLGR